MYIYEYMYVYIYIKSYLYIDNKYTRYTHVLFV